MAESKPESWTMGVALSLSVMAVIAGIVTLYMGKYSGRATMLQGQITNQWAYFQAKSIKQHTYELQKQNLELQLLVQKPSMTRGAQDQYMKVINDDAVNVSRYGTEKEDIKKQADEMEAEKQKCQQRSGKLSYALIFLQISIMLSSVTLITKRKQLWYFGMALSLAGIYFAAIGQFFIK